MCTLAALVQQDPRYPLVLAANRDERLDRAASAPRLWDGSPRFLAPVDEVAGGTWLGLNRAGLFVGVTNRFGVTKDGARDSRGTLVTEALGSPSAAALHATLASLSPTRFNAFHLFYADAAGAFVTWSDGTELFQQALAPGLHVITERSLGGDDRARTELVRARFPSEPTPEHLGALMGQHRPDDPLGSTCVHAPAFHYGTRSSLLLLLAPTIEASRWFWAEGAPCTHPYREQPELLRALAGGEP